MATYWILFIAVAVLSYIVQAVFQRKFDKASAVYAGLTGRETAERMLASFNIRDVRVTSTRGQLTDNFNPADKTVNLSEAVYGQNSVAAVAVAAHECGHAVQDSKDYIMMRLRTALVPVSNLASRAGYIAILIGILLSSYTIIKIGILAEVVILLFQLVTLPVEIDASRRALAGIKEWGFLSAEEHPQGRKMLIAAALTYVAGVVSALLQVLRLVLMFRRRDN